MTSPAPPPEQQDDGHGVIVAAVVGLALIALESRVRQEVEDDITTGLAAFLAVVLAGLATIPAGLATGIGFVSWAYIHTNLTKTIFALQTKVRRTVAAGYQAAAQLALQNAQAALGPDYHVPGDLPELGGTIDHIGQDIDTMFGQAQIDLQNRMAAAYDPNADLTDQHDALSKAVGTAGSRLQQRASAAAATAVHRGHTDAQQAIYTEYANHTTDRLGKRWIVTSATPCDMCAALNGTVVPVHSEFDHEAAADSKDFRPVWRGLQGPPRHPNCRCQVELVTLG